MRTLLLAISLSVASVSVAATDPLAHRGRIVSIIVDQAATIGVDYRETMRRAYAYNDAALINLFRVSLVADGAGAALHAGMLRDLLSRFGDRRFSGILVRQRAHIRKRVIDDLDFDFREREWARDFPLTYRVAPHNPYWPERLKKT
jgi:hypothetical protein